MARKQFLQNVHTTKKYSDENIKLAGLKDGEIAVFQNADEPSLGIKVGNDTYTQFKDSKAVTAEITSAKTELSETIQENTKNIGELTAKFGSYATSAQTVAADTKTLTDANAYTDTLKGSGYTNETLAGLKSEINSLKGNSDTTVGAVASRVTTIEGILGKTDEEGLRKDVANLKTTVGDSTTGLVKDVADLKTKDTNLNKKIDAVSGASSAYTDSQINAIKGTSYKEGTTLASLESNLGTEKGRIDTILKDAPTDLKSFKDVDTKITNAITAAYKYQGSVDNYSDLPESGKTIGFVYNVKNAVGNIGDENYTPAGTNYAWNGTEWDALGGTIDLSTYATKTYVNNALTGVTGTGENSIVTKLGTAETDIAELKKSASTLDTDVKTIKGWKINDKFISGSPILNGTDIKVDDAESAQTLKDAIAAAKTAGDNAMTYATGVSGSVKTLTDTVNSNKTTIDAYTVNETKISENPVLTGENVLVGGTSEDKGKTLNATIAEAKAAGTTASEAITTLRGGYEGTIKTINDSVAVNTSNITKLKSDVNDISGKANSAIQTITVTNTGTNKITATQSEGSTEVVLNFDNMVIDCGDF